jgi:hypothetical protein
LLRHFALAQAFGEGAEDRFQESLRALREDRVATVAALQTAYAAAKERDYAFRWLAADTLALVGGPDALEPLRTIATSTVPPERGDGEQIFTRSEEAAIRMVALDGLAALAHAGETRADDALLEVAAHATDPSIRNRAIWSYLEAGPEREQRASQLREVLPPELHAVIDRPAITLAQLLAQNASAQASTQK